MAEPKKKVLIVEDDHDLLELMSLKLTKAGMQILQAATGHEALTLIKLKPDLVLLDILLPDIDGLTILHEIASNESTKSIPVIILTNLDRRGSMQQTEAVGDYEYLVKAKVDLNTLVTKIKENLGIE